MHPEKGWVSAQCQFYDHDGERTVWVRGVPLYRYRLEDRNMERIVWSGVYEEGLARYSEIARATGIPRRTLQSWVRRRRERGVAGLLTQPSPGRPRTKRDAVRDQVLRLRASRVKLNDIARAVGVRVDTVVRILQEAEATRRNRTPDIPGLESPRESESVENAASEDLKQSSAPQADGGPDAEGEGGES